MYITQLLLKKRSIIIKPGHIKNIKRSQKISQQLMSP